MIAPKAPNAHSCKENITNQMFPCASDKTASTDVLLKNPEDSFLTLESLSDIFHLCRENFTFIKCMTVGHIKNAELHAARDEHSTTRPCIFKMTYLV